MTRYVNVLPAGDKARKHVRHPSGVGFHDNPDGTAWPDDGFTRRRLMDGDIVLAAHHASVSASQAKKKDSTWSR